MLCIFTLSQHQHSLPCLNFFIAIPEIHALQSPASDPSERPSGALPWGQSFCPASARALRPESAWAGIYDGRNSSVFGSRPRSHDVWFIPMSLFSFFLHWKYFLFSTSFCQAKTVLIFDVTDVMTENEKMNFGLVGCGFWGLGGALYF